METYDTITINMYAPFTPPVGIIQYLNTPNFTVKPIENWDSRPPVPRYNFVYDSGKYEEFIRTMKALFIEDSFRWF